MDAVTVNHATQNLNHLIGQVISNVEPTIICNDKGERALLMSLDEFNSWQSCRVGNVLLLPTYSLSLEIKKI
jgi:PHD/YefM family antitoxin component YafN of YafNO toxin-antitoxin module